MAVNLIPSWRPLGYLYEQVIILLQTNKDMENLGHKLWHGFFVQLYQDVPESESGAQTLA